MGNSEQDKIKAYREYLKLIQETDANKAKLHALASLHPELATIKPNELIDKLTELGSQEAESSVQHQVMAAEEVVQQMAAAYQQETGRKAELVRDDNGNLQSMKLKFQSAEQGMSFMQKQSELGYEFQFITSDGKRFHSTGDGELKTGPLPDMSSQNSSIRP